MSTEHVIVAKLILSPPRKDNELKTNEMPGTVAVFVLNNEYNNYHIVNISLDFYELRQTRVIY